jgi:hypothetical protein
LKVTVDFSDVKSGGAIPIGQYPGVIADAVLKQKEGSDHPYINWDVVVAEGEYEGRHQFGTTSFKPSALWKMMETFQNLGVSAQEVELEFDDTTSQLVSPEVIGLPCVIDVFQEEYNGRMTSKISNILTVNGENVGAPAAAEEEQTAAKPRPATKATPAAAAKNGPAPVGAAKRSPFPATAAKRTFK